MVLLVSLVWVVFVLRPANLNVQSACGHALKFRADLVAAARNALTCADPSLVRRQIRLSGLNSSNTCGQEEHPDNLILRFEHGVPNSVHLDLVTA